jgi:hypothetical protein
MPITALSVYCDKHFPWTDLAAIMTEGLELNMLAWMVDTALCRF